MSHDPGNITVTGRNAAANLNAIQIEQLRQEILAGSPYIDFQYVTVTFGSADTDLDIRHDLRPANPENIYYAVVKADRATSIYNDQSGTRRAWNTGYIILRSSAASAVVTLLLAVPHI